MGFDESIYFQSREYLYALTEAGKLKWKSAMTFPGIYSAPAIGLDGTVYLGSSDEPMLFAFNADGTTKWCLSAELLINVGWRFTSDWWCMARFTSRRDHCLPSRPREQIFGSPGEFTHGFALSSAKDGTSFIQWI
ncbi:MAG: PQQ-binding-like beta-propeller repeat protein [Verrucomicrobiota bacterium]